MGHPTTPQGGGHLEADQVPRPEDTGRRAIGDKPEEILPLFEETATVHTCEVVTGKVRVQTITGSIEELARASLRSGSVEITRAPVNRGIDVALAGRTENDVVILPVLEVVFVVEKQLVLKEELHIRRRVQTEGIEVPVTLRKQQAVVEQVALDGTMTQEDTGR